MLSNRSCRRWDSGDAARDALAGEVGLKHISIEDRTGAQRQAPKHTPIDIRLLLKKYKSSLLLEIRLYQFHEFYTALS